MEGQREMRSWLIFEHEEEAKRATNQSIEICVMDRTVTGNETVHPFTLLRRNESAVE